MWLRSRRDRPANMDGAYCGPVFLLCGGPSLRETPVGLLRKPGVVTAVVNNAPLGTADYPEDILRPHIWITADRPGHFHPILWQDAAITKFVRETRATERYRLPGPNGWQKSGAAVEDVSNTWLYKLTDGFNPHRFLGFAHPTWQPRSILLPALWILHRIGFRKVYLVGCDFQARKDRQYAWLDAHDNDGLRQNRDLFALLNDRVFPALLPHFDEHGFSVVNCTPGGALTALPRMSLEAAVASATVGMPVSLDAQGLCRAYR